MGQFVLEGMGGSKLAPCPPAKELGAYYTDAQIAEFLCSWAIKSSNDTVLDPSFGGGIFLRNAARRISELGGDPGQQTFGIEIDVDVHRVIARKLADEYGINANHLYRQDFFDQPRGGMLVNVVVGNPPFIRFHRFAGVGRDKARARASDSGVNLSQLASSWAHFIVHACSMLNPGGCIAMVVPAEIGYAKYAQPVLRFLSESFTTVRLLAFREKLFPNLNESTYLLLADGKGRGSARILVEEHASIGELLATPNSRAESVDVTEAKDGDFTLAEAFAPPLARDLYRKLKADRRCPTLGSIAEVGIGYVTGANDFFHLSPSTAAGYGLATTFLRKAVVSGRAIRGSRFTLPDWESASKNGSGAYLFFADKLAERSKALENYLAVGVQRDVPNGYKCRNRQPWFSVPNVYRPDALLTYMSGKEPLFASVTDDVVAPNTLHVVRMRKASGIDAASVAAGWQTALARFSMEVEGHALGGGMLKLEPSEASRLLVPPGTPEMNVEIDALLRRGREREAREISDRCILVEHLGLSWSDVQVLRVATDHLKSRRCGA